MFRTITCAFVTLTLAACSWSNYTRFEPIEDLEVVNLFPVPGGVGEKSDVGGIDVWKNGGPHRNFEEIGRITDYGPHGLFLHHLRVKDVARVAASNGGDAVVKVRQDSSGCVPNNAGGADCMDRRVYVVINYTK